MTTNQPHIDIDEGEEFARQAFDIVARLKPQLAGHTPAMQGAVIADLLSLWVAGHAPSERERIFDLFLGHAWALVPASEMEIFGERGHPDSWGGQ